MTFSKAEFFAVFLLDVVNQCSEDVVFLVLWDIHQNHLTNIVTSSSSGLRRLDISM